MATGYPAWCRKINGTGNASRVPYLLGFTFALVLTVNVDTFRFEQLADLDKILREITQTPT